MPHFYYGCSLSTGKISPLQRHQTNRLKRHHRHSGVPEVPFFTVTATCFGFYAQPRGSLLFGKSGRVWRLSPLYALADTMTIFWVWICALGRLHQLHQQRPSFKTIAASVLVMRIANDRDALRETAGVKKYRAPPARKSGMGPSSTNQDSISILQLLEEVDRYESGPTFRVFVWAPMLLQLLKLLVVRGSLLPRSLGFVFFFSWFVNDVLLIVASSDTLSPAEKSQAVFIIDDGNPQALQLIPGSYLKSFRYAVFFAQNTVSVCLIAAFGTGGWQNMIALRDVNSTAFTKWLQAWPMLSVWSAFALSFGCYCLFLVAMDLACEMYKSSDFDDKKKILDEGAAAYTAIIDWILRLLCFLSIAPLEEFHDAKKTLQPSWYEWLG